jgi:hypothetical protein
VLQKLDEGKVIDNISLDALMPSCLDFTDGEEVLYSPLCT